MFLDFLSPTLMLYYISYSQKCKLFFTIYSAISSVKFEKIDRMFNYHSQLLYNCQLWKGCSCYTSGPLSIVYILGFTLRGKITNFHFSYFIVLEFVLFAMENFVKIFLLVSLRQKMVILIGFSLFEVLLGFLQSPFYSIFENYWKTRIKW